MLQAKRLGWAEDSGSLCEELGESTVYRHFFEFYLRINWFRLLHIEDFAHFTICNNFLINGNNNLS